MGKKSRPRSGDSPESFSGIKNQGATCYLNTLLQTLYMTPEMKETISRFVQNPPETLDKKTSICYHLDALFTDLGAKRTAQTRGITRNLGMSEKDVFEQQDIEEYFRRILNEVDKESNGSFNILQIYQSNVINSMTCLKCAIETPEKCPLLDIPLPIRSFEHSFNFKCVNESLREFLKITPLGGDNSCYCENCDEKTETETRYYFESLPNILALQLKRFEFDYYMMCFTKLHDLVEIPLKLQFQKINNANKTEWRLIPVESKNAANLTNPGPQPSKRPRIEESQKLPEDERQEDYTTFELFSICNHSGGYGSGHYFAHIKSSYSSKWYCFDDTNVKEKTDFNSEASCNDGGSPSSMSSISSETAYMLMYRKEGVNIDQGENTDEDGAGNHDLEQNIQPPVPIKDLPEKNATVTKQEKGTIEKGKCETMVMGIPSEETDVKVDVQVITENSTEMATAEKTQGEQSQIGRKENIMGEDGVGQQKDSKRRTIRRMLDMEKENGDEQLNEKFIESNEDEKNRKEASRIGGTNPCIERMEGERIVQEGNDTIGQNKTELFHKEQKSIVPSNQHAGSQCANIVEEIKHEEPVGMEQTKYPSLSEEDTDEDGAGNHDLEQNNQPPVPIKDLPEKNATVTKQEKGTIEKGKCETMVTGIPSEETDVKVDVQFITESSIEMATAEKTQGEQSQIGRKENIMGEDGVGQQKDSKRRTIRRMLDTEKENGDEQLNEKFIESNEDEKNMKEASRIGGTNPCIERMEGERIVQEGNDTIGQNKTELYDKEQKSIVPSNQCAGSQCANMVEEIKHEEPVGMEQTKYPSSSEADTNEDGAGNHDLEQNNQPPVPIKDLPEKNATVTKQGKGTIEKGKCETMVTGIPPEETDVKEDVQFITESSIEMATAEKTQGEQSQIGRKENIMGEDGVGQQNDSKRRTIGTMLDMEKENGDEQLNEKFIESNEDEKIRDDRGSHEEEVQPLVKVINKEEGSQDQTSGKCIPERQVESELTGSAIESHKRERREILVFKNYFRRNKTGPKKEGVKQRMDYKKKSKRLRCSCLKGQD
ncbi:uncharacterized protein LOC119976206 [Scyliorhinus canicula]|uniref:uncharacterized protein LOC119976206 n=1 Tax=Scyliorhinus canicula TaxID=7830 RepID=UPI0018F2F791|nr:uncharacterized protein LOC119976206 [Scyliorhinus canicula]